MVAGRAVSLGVVLVLLLWHLALCRQSNEVTYDWDKTHRTTVNEGESKGVCFWKGSTSCVKYRIEASRKILAFVAKNGDAQDAFHGIRRVNYLPESVCVGDSCEANMKVSESYSYCLVIVNRNNIDPLFTDAVGEDVIIEFRVSGCAKGFWTIVGVIIVFVLLIAIFSSCVACCLHFWRKRDRRQPEIQMSSIPQVVPGSVPVPSPELEGNVAPLPLNGQESYPQVAVGVPQGRPIQFLEAKL